MFRNAVCQAYTLDPSDAELVPGGRILEAHPASPGHAAMFWLVRRHSAAGQPARNISKQPGFLCLRRIWRTLQFGCMSASQGLPAGLAGACQVWDSEHLMAEGKGGAIVE